MLRVALSLSPALLGLLVVMMALDVPSDRAYDDPADPLAVLLLALAAMAAIDSGGSALRRQRESRRAEGEETMRGLAILCRRAFVPINEQFGEVPIGEIGVHVWRVADDGQRLLRVYRFTMEHERVETPLKWVRGRGVLGLAWETRKAVAVNDLRRLAEEAETADEAEFDRRPPGRRAGLTRAEHLAASGRYAAILAVPLFAAEGEGDPSVVGLFSVDFSVDVDIAGLRRLEQIRDFRNILGSCQNLLRTMTDRSLESAGT